MKNICKLDLFVGFCAIGVMICVLWLFVSAYQNNKQNDIFQQKMRTPYVQSENN
jgi:hypothetical protein